MAVASRALASARFSDASALVRCATSFLCARRAEVFTQGVKSIQTGLDATKNDVVLQFETTGGNLTTTAWAVNDPDKKYPISWPNVALRPTGALGLGFGSGKFEDRGDGASVAAAKDVSVTIRSYQVSS